MTANEALDAYFSARPRWESVYIANKLMEHLQLPKYRLWSWRKRNSPIEHIYRVEISKFLGEEIFANVTD